MAKYAVRMTDAAATTATTTGEVRAPAASMRRGKLYDFVYGSQDVAADNPFNICLERINAVGTGTGITPAPLDPADAACVAVALENNSVNPTYAGGVLLDVSMNQRSTFRWVAAPGRELVWPATANNGIGVRVVLGPGLKADATVHFEEQ